MAAASLWPEIYIACFAEGLALTGSARRLRLLHSEPNETSTSLSIISAESGEKWGLRHKAVAGQGVEEEKPNQTLGSSFRGFRKSHTRGK